MSKQAAIIQKESSIKNPFCGPLTILSPILIACERQGKWGLLMTRSREIEAFLCERTNRHVEPWHARRGAIEALQAVNWKRSRAISCRISLPFCSVQESPAMLEVSFLILRSFVPSFLHFSVNFHHSSIVYSAVWHEIQNSMTINKLPIFIHTQR